MSNVFVRLKNNKTLLKGGLFSVFSFFNRGMGMVLLVLLANYIAPADYGRLSLFTTIVQFLVIVIALSSEGFFSVSYFQRRGELFKRDVSSISVIAIANTLFLCIILLFIQHWLSRVSDLPTPFLWITIPIALFQIFQHLLLDYYRVREKIWLYGAVSTGNAILNFVTSLVLVITFGLGWMGRAYSQLACTVLFGILGVFVFLNKGLFSRHVDWSNIKMVAIWGLPLIPHHAANWIRQGGDRFIINSFYSVEEVGIFSFALTITSVIVTLGIAFNSTNSVSIYQTLSSDIPVEQKKKKLDGITKNIYRIYVIGFVLCFIGGVVLVPILLPRYSSSVPYFAITAFYGFLQCLYFLYSNYLFYYHKNKDVMMITFLSSLFHLGLSFALTRYSLYLTSVVYVITQLVVLILIMSRCKKVLLEKNYSMR